MSSNDRRRRPLYAPPSRQRSTLSTYAPLVITLTIASAGLVAWIWSERRSDGPDDDYRYGSSDDETAPPTYKSRTDGGYDPRAGPAPEAQGEGWIARAGNAIGVRSPSPGQVWDSAGRAVGAGVAAVAGGVAAAGTALGLGKEEERRDVGEGRSKKGKRVVREGREDGFSDHERWSEEAVLKKEEVRSKVKEGPAGKRKIVAVVVSAENAFGDAEEMGIEHASILSHLPPHHNPSTTDLFVLIFAPQLNGQDASSRSNPGLSSSYSTISLPGSSNRVLSALQTQAEALVSSPTQILPFTTPTGYVHILRHIAPSLVYVQDSSALSGQNGEHIASLKGWVGQTIVVVGDDGTGGLADTETETEDEGGKGKRREAWYESSEIVGLGKGTEVVDVRRVGDDWAKRVNG